MKVRNRWLIIAGILLAAGGTAFLAWEPDPPPPSSSQRIGEGEPAASPTHPPAPTTSASAASAASESPAQRTFPTASCDFDPEADGNFLKYRREQARVSIPPLYEDVASQVGLSAEETARFLDMLVEHDAQRAMPWEMMCDGVEEARRARKELNLRQRAELESFIGAQRMPAFEQFEASRDARFEVQAMAETLRLSHLPLTENQRRTLLETFLRPGAVMARREYGSGETPTDYRRALDEWMDQNDQLLLANARQVLDADQLGQYAQFLEDRRENFIHGEFVHAGVEHPVPDPD